MTKKRKPDIGNGQKIIIFLISLTFVSSLVLTKLVIDNSRIKQGDVTVYDQNLEDWSARDMDGVFQLLAVSTASTEDIERINPENVFTAECGYIIQKPEEVTLTCADGGISVQDIKWDIWRASGASGSGIHTVNQCKPDCVTGKWIEVPVEVKLTRLMTDGDKFYLTSFNAYSLDEKVLDLGWSYPWEFERINLAEDGSIATPFLD
jgi:hypothetical protein